MVRREVSSELDWATVRSADGLGTFLNHLRVQRGWTQADVAEHLGIPRRYLHELESGKQILAYSRLFSLMNLLRAQMVLRAESEENDPWQV